MLYGDRDPRLKTTALEHAIALAISSSSNAMVLSHSTADAFGGKV